MGEIEKEHNYLYDDMELRLDMVGKWTSIWNGDPCSYHLRLTVETGKNGEYLWRGTAADQPFWGDLNSQVDEKMIEKMALMPAHKRICTPLTYPLQTSFEVIQERGGGLVGDEVPIGGIVQWKIAEEEGNEEFLKNYIGGDIERKLALEFVSGCFSPSTRRLVIHGTHLSNAGYGAIGRDIYDLIVSEDRQSISGVSQSNDSFESARVEMSAIDKYANHTVDGVDFSSMRDRDCEQKKMYERAAAALEKIKDEDARNRVRDAQATMFALACEDEDYTESFKELKEIGEFHSARLNNLIALCMQKYQHLKERYSFLESIEDLRGQEQRPIPSKLCGETPSEQVRVLLAIARYQEPEFRNKIRTIVTSLNRTAADPENYSFEKFKEDFDLGAANLPFGLESAISIAKFDKKTVAKCHFGPPKGFERALTKIKEGGTLKDLNRATILFEDPYVMAVAFMAIKAKHKVVTVKNKLRQENGFSQPPDLHLILDIDNNGWLVEIQLMFNDILTVKKEMHKFYEIVRATTALEILAPIFSLDVGDNTVTF